MVDSYEYFFNKVMAFLTKNRMADSTFGRISIGDDHLIEDLRKGREPRKVTRDKILEFMKNYGSTPKVGAPRCCDHKPLILKMTTENDDT